MVKVTFGRIACDPSVNHGAPSLRRTFPRHDLPALYQPDHDVAVLAEAGYGDWHIHGLMPNLSTDFIAACRKDRDAILAAPRPDTKRLHPRGQQIPVKDVLTLLDAGYRNSDLQDFLPGLDDKDIAACQGFAATRLTERSEYAFNNRYKTARVLLDENVSPFLVQQIYRHLGGLSHIYYEGLSGVTDEFIYWRPQARIEPGAKRPRADMRHVIITHDSDLCDLAQAQWLKRIRASAEPEKINFNDTNTIILLTGRGLGTTRGANDLAGLAREIMKAAFSDKQAPWYRANRSGVKEGISLSDLIALAEKSDRKFRQSGLEDRDVVQATRIRLRQERARQRSGDHGATGDQLAIPAVPG